MSLMKVGIVSSTTEYEYSGHNCILRGEASINSMNMKQQPCGLNPQIYSHQTFCTPSSLLPRRAAQRHQELIEYWKQYLEIPLKQYIYLLASGGWCSRHTGGVSFCLLLNDERLDLLLPHLLPSVHLLGRRRPTTLSIPLSLLGPTLPPIPPQSALPSWTGAGN